MAIAACLIHAEIKAGKMMVLILGLQLVSLLPYQRRQKGTYSQIRLIDHRIIVQFG